VQPDSAGRFAWDMLGLLLVFYDLVVIPLQLLEPPETPFSVAMSWVTRIFWTVDIPATFVTGVIMPDGHIQLERVKIVRRYLLGPWFVLDLMLVTVDWLEVIHQISWGSIMRMTKGMRMLRILRLLRVARMQSVLRRFFEMVNSERFFIMADIVGVLLVIVGSAHVMACVWYGIGAHVSTGYGGEADPKSWVYSVNLDSSPLAERYALSLHWSFSQFAGGMDEVSPQNMLERVYSILAFLLAFIMAAAFVSNLTTSLSQLRNLSVREASQFGVLRRYLGENGISSTLSLRVRRNVQHALKEQNRSIAEDKVELLALVSEPLRMELHLEIYSRILSAHGFFGAYCEESPHTMGKVCHRAVAIAAFSMGDLIFDAGEISGRPKMYFVCEGSLAYTAFSGETRSVLPGHWVSEGALWTQWMHRGSLAAAANCRLCELDAARFQEIASDARVCNFEPRTYAKQFVDYLNQLGRDADDLSVMPWKLNNKKSVTNKAMFKKHAKHQRREYIKVHHASDSPGSHSPSRQVHHASDPPGSHSPSRQASEATPSEAGSCVPSQVSSVLPGPCPGQTH